ncbi:MAG: NlpC/P60 family protein [Desulfuromonadales bacterium]|nr:NlpC/P60 family protein [Desulfuromonadales bacterium]
MLRFLCIPLLIALLLGACSSPPPAAKRPAPKPAPQAEVDPIAALLSDAPAQQGSLSSMGYSVQVGAFSNLDNAVRLEGLLKQRGIDAYYFRHESGLYKVRFGNHASYKPARAEAERLQAQGLIDRFFIVAPQDYAAAKIAQSGRGDLRSELVKTAKRFIGIPYRWGGTDADNGFDCSGLTMVCYRLNGLNLPRVSRSQFGAGRWVAKAKLRPGDLVFFATGGGKRVSHVGMYIGNGEFIHAPRTGKKVRIEKLSNSYFAKVYMGGRTYL